jgi:hypothetical protein
MRSTGRRMKSTDFRNTLPPFSERGLAILSAAWILRSFLFLSGFTGEGWKCRLILWSWKAGILNWGVLVFTPPLLFAFCVNLWGNSELFEAWTEPGSSSKSRFFYIHIIFSDEDDEDFSSMRISMIYKRKQSKNPPPRGQKSSSRSSLTPLF